MGAVFLLYIVYCVVVMYIPQSRQFLIDGVMDFVRYVLFGIKQITDPEFLKMAGLGIAALAGAGLIIFLVVSLILYLMENEYLIGYILGLALFAAGMFAMPFIFGWLLGFIIVMSAVFYIGLPIIGLVIIVYLPAVFLLLYKYADYKANPHEAELQFKKMKIEGEVKQNDVDAVRDAMLQSDRKGFSTDDGLVNVKNVLFGWIHTENRKEHLRRLREEMEEETESLNAFKEYVSAKNNKYGSDYDK